MARFPTQADLQAQAGNPVRAASSSSGFGLSLNGALEYQSTANLALGALLELERSDGYAPTQVLLYARYLFEPVRAPQLNRARPVQAYSSF